MLCISLTLRASFDFLTKFLQLSLIANVGDFFSINLIKALTLWRNHPLGLLLSLITILIDRSKNEISFPHGQLNMKSQSTERKIVLQIEMRLSEYWKVTSSHFLSSTSFHSFFLFWMNVREALYFVIERLGKNMKRNQSNKVQENMIKNSKHSSVFKLLSKFCNFLCFFFFFNWIAEYIWVFLTMN